MGMLKVPADHLQLRSGAGFPVLAHLRRVPWLLGWSCVHGEIRSVPACCLQRALLLSGSSTTQA